MRLINAFTNRAFTAILKLLQQFLPQKNQITFAGQNSSQQLCQHVLRMGHSRILLITDKILVELGLADGIRECIEGQGGTLTIYDGVLPDPTSDMVETALALLQSHSCDAVIAMGGGSAIDTAKGVTAAATNGDIKKLIGILKVKQGPLPLFAIPTTSGTGSEVSLAAVISDAKTHEKGVMGDPKLVPLAVALDPVLLKGMPPSVTASTAMDALSHAIETYVGRWSNASVKNYSGAAVKLIFENADRAYQDGQQLDAREAMGLASYYAGLSLNQGSVGNIHALAHQLGGQYGIPHGIAISMVMPHVLEASIDTIDKSLSELSIKIGVGDSNLSNLQNARRFIEALRQLQSRLNMPSGTDQIRSSDIKPMAKNAIKEALAYPVPYFISRSKAQSILRSVSA